MANKNDIYREKKPVKEYYVISITKRYYKNDNDIKDIGDARLQFIKDVSTGNFKIGDTTFTY
jgi:DNA-binding protein